MLESDRKTGKYQPVDSELDYDITPPVPVKCEYEQSSPLTNNQQIVELSTITIKLTS